jgi:hypothetical protein
MKNHIVIAIFTLLCAVKTFAGNVTSFNCSGSRGESIIMVIPQLNNSDPTRESMAEFKYFDGNQLWMGSNLSLDYRTVTVAAEAQCSPSRATMTFTLPRDLAVTRRQTGVYYFPIYEYIYPQFPITLNITNTDGSSTETRLDCK